MAIVIVGLLMLGGAFYDRRRSPGPWTAMQRAMIGAGLLIVAIGIVFLVRR